LAQRTKDELGEMQRYVQEREIEFRQVQAKFEQLESAMDVVVNSNSWKLTALLRWAGQKIRSER